MVLSWHEISGLGALGIYFALSGFAWLLPLKAYLKNWDDALRLCIPISLSFQILFAYIFYTFNAIGLYPYAYFVSLFAINIGVMFMLGKVSPPRAKGVSLSHSLPTILALIFVTLAFISTRFFDAFSTAAPGAIDTFNHMRFMRDLQEVGHLSFQSYAPGFHLLVYPINLIVGDGLIYRFVGSVIGLLLGLSLYFLFRQDIRTLSARLLLLALLSFPVFLPLILQTISFFPTVLTFILLPAILSFLIHDYRSIGRGVYGLMLILILSLSVTVPYLFVQIIPPFLILIPWLFFFRSQLSRLVVTRIIMLTTLLLVGFCTALVLTYAQGKLYAPSVSFPTVGLLEVTPSPRPPPSPSPASTSSPSPASIIDVLAERLKSTVKRLESNPLYLNFVVPFVNSGWDIIRVKSIRPLNSVFSIGAYIWGILSIGVLAWALRRKYAPIVLMSYLCVFFTIITQTGVLEITTYRGRSGWYLLLFTLLSLVFIFDKMRVSTKPIAVFIPIALASFGFLKPPTFYRPFQPHLFDVAYQLVKDAPPGNDLVFYADEPVLSILANNITVRPATPLAINEPCPTQTNCYLFVPKIYQPIDPVLAQQADTLGSNLAALEAQTKETQSLFEMNKKGIESSAAFKEYRPVIEDSALTVYQR